MPDNPRQYSRRALARQEWNRLAGLPAVARAALVADTVWNREYGPAYRTAYATAASRIAAEATEAAAASPAAWHTLHQLAAAAGEAISRRTPDYPPAPPADKRTVASAEGESIFIERAQPPWQRIADIAAAGARFHGKEAGTMTASTDILAGWRGRGGHVLAEGVAVYGKPAARWVSDLLAAVNRDVVGPAIPMSGRTTAQLAGEDQAPGATSAADSSSARIRAATPAAAAAPRRAR